MKKVLSMFLAIVVVMSALSVAASAEDVDTSVLVQPVRCYMMGLGGGAKISNVKSADGKEITGHVLSLTGAASEVSTSETKFCFYNESGKTFAPGYYPKNNFVWDFDIRVDTLSDQAYIAIGWNGAKADGKWYTGDRIRFFKHNSDATKYGIRWNDNKAGISSTDMWHAGLTLGETYHMTVKADILGRKIYTEFETKTIVDGKNVIVKSVHDMGLDLDPSKNYDNDTLYDANAGGSNAIFSFKSGGKGTYNMTVSNEKLYYDKMLAKTPVISLDGNNVKLEQGIKNVWNENADAVYTILAVYDSDGRFVTNLTQNSGSSNSGKVWGWAPYTETISYDTSALADGTYTVKAFVWNSFDSETGLRPFSNAYAEKTLTISNGTAAID